MLADNKSRQMEVLAEISELCCHIIGNCKDIGVCEDSIILKATVSLQLGKAEEVIETLEEILNPYRLSAQSDTVLTQAYMLAGRKENGDSFTQMSMFLHLLNFVAAAVQYLTNNIEDFDICRETIQRVESVASAFHLEQLHPNIASQFRYQAAVVYCIHGKKQEAFDMLKQYIENVEYLLTEENLSLHGDEYFTLIQPWFDHLDIGANAPRDKRVIFEGFVQSLQNPAFTILEDCEAYQKMKNAVTKRGEML